MNQTKILTLFALVLVASGLLAVLVLKPGANRKAPAPVKQAQASPTPVSRQEPTAEPERPAEPEEAPPDQARTSPPAPVATLTTPPKSASAAAPAGAQANPVKDPDARIALCFVGMDPDAEEYWAEAINNPDLSGDERQDLIEDLNEDGFEDPKHPSPYEVPLILNRLLIIEMLAPGAMDQVNADAFAEAYKDLINMLHLAIGGGEPIR